MSESKFKETLTSMINTGDEKESPPAVIKEKPEKDEIGAEEFNQASKSASNSQLSSSIETIKPGEQKTPDSSTTAKRPFDNTVANRKIEKAVTSDKPINIPAVKHKKKRNYMGGTTLAISIIAILTSGYAIVEQKQNEAVFQENLDVISAEMSELSLKSDDLAVSIIKVQDKVQLNTNNLTKFDTLQDYIADLEKQIENKLEEREIIQGLKDRIDLHDKTLESHGNELKELGIKIKKYSVRKAPTKKATKNVAVKKVYNDPTKLKDAVVASIDTWGTQPYVMLRDDRGAWIPMAMGDYYKGWKLSGVMGSEAVFKKGSNIRKLAIEG